MSAVAVSVIFPVYNEEENLRPLISELKGVLNGLSAGFEMICVDDCSTDASVSVIRELQQEHPELRLIRHSINSGESAATATGFAQARGDIIITMDADQQNDPADIPALLKALEGFDGVCGVRRTREDDWLKRISSKVANAFRNWTTKDTIADAGCTFRALRRHALAEIPVFNGMHRFLPTLMRLQGFTVTEILVNHRPRTRGLSKYGLGNRMFRGLVDCLAIMWFRKRCVSAKRVQAEE
jgi:dolichol-phosphate mannosyltransferase